MDHSWTNEGREGISKATKLTADSGFYNTANVTQLYQNGIDGYLPDLGFRKRDPRFAEVERYRARAKKDRCVLREEANSLHLPGLSL